MFVPKWVVERLQKEVDEAKALVFIERDDRAEWQRKAAEANVAANELRARVQSDAVTIDWLRIRVNQLELEKAALLNKQLGLELGAPIIRQQDEIERQLSQHFKSLHDDHAVSFEDMGDEKAAKEGLAHDDMGNLVRR